MTKLARLPGVTILTRAPDGLDHTPARAEAGAALTVLDSAEDQLKKALEVASADWADSTLAKYRMLLLRLAGFLGVPTVTAALMMLVGLGPLEGTLVACAWRQSLMDAGYSSAYVAQHVAALKAGWRLVRRVGLAMWDLDVKAPRVTALRDTRGPSLVEVQRLIAAAAAARAGIHGMRDLALVLLLGVLGLRRAEVARMQVSDFDQDGSRVRVLGKGRDDWEWLTLPQPVADALKAYLTARGARPDEPLFTNHDRRSKTPQRLSPSGIFHVIRRLGELAGLARPLAPHQLRHFAITQALEGTDGDVRRVKAFSRHRKLETVLVYDDRRLNHQGEIADLVAASVSGPWSNEDAGAPDAAAADGSKTAPEMVTGTGVSVTIMPAGEEG